MKTPRKEKEITQGVYQLPKEIWRERGKPGKTGKLPGTNQKKKSKKVGERWDGGGRTPLWKK